MAPFRGFLQERAALKRQGVPVGESLLFIGCRNPLQDFLYQDEMRAFEAAGVAKLHAAFSREPGKPKGYVQQTIRSQSEAVWRLLQQEAVIYVCGDASRMAPDVRKAFAWPPAEPVRRSAAGRFGLTAGDPRAAARRLRGTLRAGHRVS